MKLTYNDNIYFEDSSIKISRQCYSKGVNDMPPHHHDYLTVSLLLSGSLIEYTSKGTKTIKSGSVLIKPPSLVHGNLFTNNCTFLSLKIYDWDYYDFACEDWQIIEQTMLLKHFLKIVDRKNKKESLNQLKNGIALMTNKKHLTHIPEKIRYTKQLIDIHFLESLQIADLAKEVHMHPAHLGRTFKAYYKIGIKAYQNQLRLHFAISEMTAKKNNLTQIAYNAGYSDQSHFSREFKKLTHFSPKEVTTLLNV